MIYAYDKAANIPLVDIYDKQMMLAEIAAAKDMYEKGLEEIKDFRDKYGDFMSPIEAHQDWYNTEFDISGFVNDLYKRGIDPVRSAEGRALVQQYINSRNYGKLNQMKLSAANAQKFLESAGELASKNGYNDEFTRSILQAANGDPNYDGTVANWGSKPFTMTAAPQYQDLNEYTGHIFDKMDDSFIESDPETGLDWFGVSREQRAEALTDQLGGLLSSPLGKFHYQQSIKNFVSTHDRMPSTEEAMHQFKEDILTATKEYEHRTYKENPEYKRQRDFYWDNKLDSIKQARSNYYKTQGGGNGKEMPSVFREADRRGIGQYSLSEDPLYQWIRPAGENTSPIKNDNDQYEYYVPAVDTKNIYAANSFTGSGALSQEGYRLNASGSEVKMRTPFNSDVNFVPVGQLHKEYETIRAVNEDGTPDIRYIPHYFIRGTIRDVDGNDLLDENGNLQLFDMEVTEQDYSYGKKQGTVVEPTDRVR